MNNSEARQEQFVKVDLSKDRVKYETLADIYSIIICVEHLEIVWARGCCEDDAYTLECEKFITKYKAMLPSVCKWYPDIKLFFSEYCSDCHAAQNRLVKIGVPATTFHGSGSAKISDVKGLQLTIAQTVQYFITTMDGLQLNLKAVDEVLFQIFHFLRLHCFWMCFQIHPHLKELMECINKVTTLPPDHLSKTKVQEWLIKLNEKKASDELSDDDIRQMTFDLENAYSEFVKFLQQ